MTDDEARAVLAKREAEKKAKQKEQGEAYRAKQAELKAELLAKANEKRAKLGLPLLKPRTKAKAKSKTEATMKTKSKTNGKTKTPKTKTEAEPRGMAIEIGKLASRPNGASRAELIKLTGWKQQAWKWYFQNSKDNGFCQKFGYTLKVIEGKDGESRYQIAKR